MRDCILPYEEILKPRSGQEHVNSYPTELYERAHRCFSLCKLYQEEQKALRNARENITREFKDISIGSRIYINNMIRKHKLVPRYAGPFRVEGIAGTTIFCYDLATGKSKQVSMNRCVPSDVVSMEDNPNILNAYPILPATVIENESETSANDSEINMLAKASIINTLTCHTCVKSNNVTKI